MAKVCILMPGLPVPIPNGPLKSPFPSFTQSVEKVVSLGDARAATFGVGIYHLFMIHLTRGLSCTRSPGFSSGAFPGKENNPLPFPYLEFY